MKLNTKEFKGKNRIYVAIAGATNISKVLIWDEKRKEYLPPAKGKLYFARRYEKVATGGTKRSRKASILWMKRGNGRIVCIAGATLPHRQ